MVPLLILLSHLFTKKQCVAREMVLPSIIVALKFLYPEVWFRQEVYSLIPPHWTLLHFSPSVCPDFDLDCLTTHLHRSPLIISHILISLKIKSVMCIYKKLAEWIFKHWTCTDPSLYSSNLQLVLAWLCWLQLKSKWGLRPFHWRIIQ